MAFAALFEQQMGAQSKRFGFRRAEFALSTPCIARPPLAEETKKVLAIVDKSNDPEKIAVAERVLESYQNYMRQIGLFKSEEISTANEGKLHARWKLGQLLAKVMRGNHGPNAGRVLTGLKHLLERLHMTPPIAMEAQRIGTLPRPQSLKTHFAAMRWDPRPGSANSLWPRRR